MTYKELHVRFLDGIKKTYTGTVHPDVFVRIFNDWGIPEWVANNVSYDEGVERTQKQIDDLDRITVILPYERVEDNKIELPLDYVRMTRVMVKTSYSDNCGKITVSDFQRIYIERSDQKSYNYESAYRRPSKHRPYYKQIGEVDYNGTVKSDNKSILLFDGGDSDIVACEIEYIRRPDLLPPFGQGWETVKYIDLRREQLHEVINICVRLYLERVKDERYQTFFNEQQIRNIQKI